MKEITSLILTLLLTTLAFAQNFAVIYPGDTEQDIIAKAASITPTPRQLRWQRLELTAFFHFGVNTFSNREWGTGKEDPKTFNPGSLDAEQWIRSVKDAGIKQVILTAKHHDGFCLWPTATTNHSVKASPWKKGKGDVVDEVARAARKHKLGFGIYLSPWDMNAPMYGIPEYNDFFVAQLTELLTQYGKIDEVWFDGANGEGPNGKKQEYDFKRWYKLIRRLQPEAVIAIMGPDVRWVGTESGYGRETEWSVVPMENMNLEGIAANSQQNGTIRPVGDMTSTDIGSRDKLRKAKGLAWFPAETDVSIRPGWFYHPAEDDEVKSPEKLLDIYFSSVGRNGVLLLNIPPDTRGLVHENDVKALRDWKELRDEIFDHNLLRSAELSGKGRKLKALKDDRFKSYWTTNQNDSTAVINISFQQAQTIDVLELQENISVGQRIEGFILEYHNGTEWRPAAQGTTVGYKRLIRFPAVEASQLRLRITESRLSPTLSKIGLYNSRE